MQVWTLLSPFSPALLGANGTSTFPSMDVQGARGRWGLQLHLSCVGV